MPKGLADLEYRVKNGAVLREVTLNRLDRIVQSYWDMAANAKQRAADRERRVRALKAASKDNE